MDGLLAGVSGVRAAALGVAAVSGNIANLNSKDYRAKQLEFKDTSEGGVALAAVHESEAPLVPDGSNVDVADEFVELMTYAATYEANLKALEVQQETLGTALNFLV